MSRSALVIFLIAVARQEEAAREAEEIRRRNPGSRRQPGTTIFSLPTEPTSRTSNTNSSKRVARLILLQWPAAGFVDTCAVPEWVQLLPAGLIATGDTRGPYSVRDMAQVIALSFADGDRLPIDENHSTDLAAPKGLPAPARGWITAMEARDGSLWGRVEWTAMGRQLVEGREYRGISPVIIHDKNKRIERILRASLVNRPNLRGLARLNAEGSMDLMKTLVGVLGLDPANTTPEQVVEAIKKLQGGGKAMHAQEQQSTELRTIFGVDAEGDLVAAARASTEARTAAADGEGKVVKALQAEIADLGTEIKTLRDSGAKKSADVFVDGEIKKGRAGVKLDSGQRLYVMGVGELAVTADLRSEPCRSSLAIISRRWA